MRRNAASVSGREVSKTLHRFEQHRLAQEILRSEGRALLRLADQLEGTFAQATHLLFTCPGNVIVSGIGKAGLIGQKLVATLSSTGTRSHFLHPAEAVHGDLGRLAEGDCLVVLSFSGETDEVLRILPICQRMRVPILAITGDRQSTLAAYASVALILDGIEEACPLGLAPSTSTTAMLALGDALALVTSQMRGFTAGDFAQFHPAGSLGRRLARVEDIMRKLAECRIATQSETVRQVFIRASLPGRRTGAIMLVDDRGCLAGIFTDSDLAKLLEGNRADALDTPVSEVMTRSPATVVVGAPLSIALDMLSGQRLSELPVVDEQGRPLGMIDITDALACFPNTSGSPNPHFQSDRESGDCPSTVPFPNQPPG